MQYEEKVTTTQKDRKKVFIRILAAFVLSYLLASAYAILKLPYAGIARLVFIGIMVGGLYYAFRHGITEYIYRIDDGELVFITNSGKFDKVLCSTEIAKVQYITKGDAGTVEADCVNAAKSSGDRERYTCVFEDEKGKLCKVVFEPSQDYLAKVSELGIEVK